MTKEERIEFLRKHYTKFPQNPRDQKALISIAKQRRLYSPHTLHTFILQDLKSLWYNIPPDQLEKKKKPKPSKPKVTFDQAEFCTRNDAARMLEVHVTRIDQYCEQGLLNKHHKGRFVRLKISEVEKLKQMNPKPQRRPGRPKKKKEDQKPDTKELDDAKKTMELAGKGIILKKQPDQPEKAPFLDRLEEEREILANKLQTIDHTISVYRKNP